MAAFYHILEAKKHGRPLSGEQIAFWIENMVAGKIPDYQLAALLMAIRLNGMEPEETLLLTQAMTDSGDRFHFKGYPVLADKHSTGGVGDKVTLILAPMLAACGLPVCMLSGRGLGFSGGTIDKLEALPGVSCLQSEASMQAMLDAFGWANCQASASIAPADRILYALRDVTATVDSIPLITASILSKKLAGGSTHLCLDVKCGRSAFMEDIDHARGLAVSLQTIGRKGGLHVEGLITRMDEPLGHAVGNYLELLESVLYLKHEHQSNLMTLIYELGGKMLVQCGRAADADAAVEAMRRTIHDGSALERLCAYLRFTGADEGGLKALLDAELESFGRIPVTSTEAGVVHGIFGRAIGELMITIGAGRGTRDDVLDPHAGLVLNKRLGDTVEKGEPLAWLYGVRVAVQAEALVQTTRDCFTIRPSAIEPVPVVLESF